jgi:hypothetical protein
MKWASERTDFTQVSLILIFPYCVWLWKDGSKEPLPGESSFLTREAVSGSALSSVMLVPGATRFGSGSPWFSKVRTMGCTLGRVAGSAGSAGSVVAVVAVSKNKQGKVVSKVRLTDLDGGLRGEQLLGDILESFVVGLGGLLREIEGTVVNQPFRVGGITGLLVVGHVEVDVED